MNWTVHWNFHSFFSPLCNIFSFVSLIFEWNSLLFKKKYNDSEEACMLENTEHAL